MARGCAIDARITLRTAVLLTALLGACRDSTSPARPAAVSFSSGTATAVAGAAIEPSPTVRVLNARGQSASGVTVHFAVTAGALAREIVVTDHSGEARVEWILGPSIGEQRLTARVDGLAPISMNVQVRADVAAGLRVAGIPPSARSGEPFSLMPAVTVVDQFGNPLDTAGVQILATAVPSTALAMRPLATTDAAGTARFAGQALTGAAGPYRLRFELPNVATIDSPPISLVANNASRLALAVEMGGIASAGEPLRPQPVVEVQDLSGNRVFDATPLITVSLSRGNGQLTGILTAVADRGRAAFSDLGYAGTGSFRLRFAASGLEPVESRELLVPDGDACSGPGAWELSFQLGEMRRVLASDSDIVRCLRFDPAANAGQEFLLLFENMPLGGGFFSAVFPAPAQDNQQFSITVAARAAPVLAHARARTRVRATAAPRRLRHVWDFGGGAIHEVEPELPAGAVPAPRWLHSGTTLPLSSNTALVDVGDTIIVFMSSIPRLGIASGDQRAVVRFVSDALIIAEDIRLGTLARATGGTNVPLTHQQMAEIAARYSAAPKTQGDLLFGGRYNGATESFTPPSIVAVHSVMDQANGWGYTYSDTNVFIWDYWVGTDGRTPGVNQQPLRIALNLFMHEIAHTRHWGIMERAQRAHLRGNLWLVEGFARFAERLAISAHLLDSHDPPRTANLTLPHFPDFGGSYSRDDVPAYLEAGANMFEGYSASAFVFDYLADQVAMAGGNWRAAIGEFLVNGGLRADADRAISTLLPGVASFGELFTRSRIALFTDDYGVPGLPTWTQYHQFRLRESRPAGSDADLDPRLAWIRLRPGMPFNETRAVPPGGAIGFVIDGSATASADHILISTSGSSNGVVSITRIR